MVYNTLNYNGTENKIFQSLSESVSKALTLYGGEETEETALFVIMFDRFFDCLNVSNYTNAKRKLKVFQNPYRSADDFRIKVKSQYFHIMYMHMLLAFHAVVGRQFPEIS